MTMLATPLPPVLPVVAVPPEHQHHPTLASVLGRVGASLLVACVVPAAIFFTVLVSAGVTTAVVTAFAWTLAAMGWRHVTGRPVSGLLLLVAVVMTVRTGFTLATGNTFVYFLQPMISDSVLAAFFLVSLASARPVVSRLAGDFYPMTHELAERPGVRRLFHRLTLMWGLVCLIKAGLGLGLLLSQPMVTFVLVNSISMISLTACAALVTIVVSLLVLRTERAAHAVPVLVAS